MSDTDYFWDGGHLLLLPVISGTEGAPPSLQLVICPGVCARSSESYTNLMWVFSVTPLGATSKYGPDMKFKFFLIGANFRPFL